jgi:nucleotide-binding universal stress UspA family protein
VPLVKVLVATDGSDLAIAAARRGLRLLAEEQQVTLVHVVAFSELRSAVLGGDSGMAGSVDTPEQAAAQDEQRLAEADSVLTRTAATLGVTGAERRVEIGDPATVICDAAAELGAAVIVMGTHGRGAVGQMFLGSVSQHVVRHAPCPVLLAGSGARVPPEAALR